MGIKFNADEVFQMAMRIEENGAAFYRKAAQGVECADAKGGLLKLAGMEDEHKRRFEEMKANLTSGKAKTVAFDPDNMVVEYLGVMADGYVFDTNQNPASLIEGDEPLTDILKTAIGLEKDSIVFYSGIRENVPERLGRNKIDDIIREEMGHITVLNRELKKASK